MKQCFALALVLLLIAPQWAHGGEPRPLSPNEEKVVMEAREILFMNERLGDAFASVLIDEIRSGARCPSINDVFTTSGVAATKAYFEAWRKSPTLEEPNTPACFRDPSAPDDPAFVTWSEREIARWGTADNIGEAASVFRKMLCVNEKHINYIRAVRDAVRPAQNLLQKKTAI